MTPKPLLTFLAGGLVVLAVSTLGFSQTEEKSRSEKPPEIDPISGMKIDTHWQTVRAMCSSCHSPKLFTNYGGTRETWLGLIRWMQKKQGLWELPPEIEDQILTYLAKNYPPGEASRRRNLPVHLRPPNPYPSEAREEYEAKLQEGKIEAPDLPQE
jgi:hypothetical protein